MDETVKWFLGQAAGFIAAAFLFSRHVMQSIAEGDDRLHQRINDVRDKYVRRDDLAAHMDRQERELKEHIVRQERELKEYMARQERELQDMRSEMRVGQKDTATRLDQLVTALAKHAE